MKHDIDENVICYCHNITKTFKEHTVLQDVSFRITKGSITGIIGRNGCGKTTLLSIIAGLINGTSGNIQFQRDRPVLGALIHSPAFFSHLNAYDNLNYIATLKKLTDRDKHIKDVLKKVGLTISDKSYKKFSLGMSQRLGIAAALIGNPDLIILDEPTNGIDPVDIEEVKGLIKTAIRPDSAIIVTSHAIHDIIDISDHLIVMRAGQVILDDRIDNLQARVGAEGVSLKESLIKLL